MKFIVSIFVLISMLVLQSIAFNCCLPPSYTVNHRLSVVNADGGAGTSTVSYAVGTFAYDARLQMIAVNETQSGTVAPHIVPGSPYSQLIDLRRQLIYTFVHSHCAVMPFNSSYTPKTCVGARHGIPMQSTVTLGATYEFGIFSLKHSGPDASFSVDVSIAADGSCAPASEMLSMTTKDNAQIFMDYTFWNFVPHADPSVFVVPAICKTPDASSMASHFRVKALHY